MKIVICGFGSAGYAAAMSIRRAYSSCDVTVIDPKPHDLMHPCGLPYALEGIVDPALLVQDINLDLSRISRIRGEACAISAAAGTVSVNTSSGPVTESYDSLILATGSRPVLPAVEGLEGFMGKSAFTLAGVDDLNRIIERSGETGSCVVIGGGAIGIEVAHALRNRLKQVTIIEMRDQLLPGIVDPDMAGLAEAYLDSCGISVIKSKSVNNVRGSGGVMELSGDGLSLQAGMVIVAAGSRPGLSLAESSGIECSAGGIKTDTYLRTRAGNIYAAGDCIANWSVVDGKPVSSRLATSAYRQGTLAGINACGGSVGYAGSACTFVTRFGGFELAGTGLSASAAAERGFDPVAGRIRSRVRPDYYPSNTEITMKILSDKSSGRVLGAQCAGSEGAASRINLVSMAIEFGLRLDELAGVELAYCPAVSEVYDPLLRAADFGLRRSGR